MKLNNILLFRNFNRKTQQELKNKKSATKNSENILKHFVTVTKRKYYLPRGEARAGARQIFVFFWICLSGFCGHSITKYVFWVLKQNPQNVYFIYFPTREKYAVVENSF